jgi:hypothetical protein
VTVTRKKRIALLIAAGVILIIAALYLTYRVPGVNWDEIADNLVEVRVYVQVPGVGGTNTLLNGPCLYKISEKVDVEKFAQGLRNLKSKSNWLYGESISAEAQYYTILVTNGKTIETDYHPGYGIRGRPEGLSYPIWYGSTREFDSFLTEHLQKAKTIYEQHYGKK